MKKVLMVIAPRNFRDEEYFETKEELEKAGCEVVTACSEKTAVSQVEMKEIVVDLLLRDVNFVAYDGVVFVGGAGSSCYFHDEKALQLAADAYKRKRVVGAICLASSVLANSGILKGKKATGWPSEKENIIAHGGTYTGQDVTVDGIIVTGNGPHAASAFGKALAKLLMK